MSTIWKLGAAAVTVVLLGGFYLGRVVGAQGPLPEVGRPVTVGVTAEATTAPTVAGETPTLRPRADRPGHRRSGGAQAHGDRPGGDDHGGNRVRPDDDEDGDNHGDNSGPGGGGDDDIETVEPSPSVLTFDDHGGDNSGPGGGDDSGGGDDGGADD